MSTTKYVPKFKPKPNDEDKYINILLLGETGVGKSTFINSFVNYLQFSQLVDAQDQKLTCLIPTKFSIHTEDGDTTVLNFLNDKNEDAEVGNSSTQGAKAYVFPYENKMIRLIDTPGINDSRGAVVKDAENFENILEYIGSFKHLHAVCFLLKPDVTVLTASFKYCLIELFSRLDRSAAANIAFLFTRTRSTFYKAPDTVNCIRRVLDDIARDKGVTIPLRFKGAEQTNCFYFDNEGFKYLVAMNQGVRIGDAERLKESWDVSYASSWRLIQYIVGDEQHAPLPPHNVQDTVSVNKARLLIFELAKPLADITELVQDNLDTLKRHQERIVQENLTNEELKDILYVPVIDLEEKPLPQPVTVCAAGKCTDKYTVAGLQKNHFKQRCHNPCYLNGIPKEIIGDPGLVHCAAMNGKTNCSQCGCHFDTHMHVYYETTTIESRIEDKTVQSQLQTNQQLITAQYVTIKKLEERVKTFQSEHKEVSNALATFAYFLHNNSICPINDAYEAYLDCLIQREKIAFGSDKMLLDRYQALKKEHIEQKRLLDEAGRMAKAKNISHVTSNQIIAIWERLKKLPLTGKKIANLHRMLTEKKHGEILKNMEYVHTYTARKPQPVQKAMPVEEAIDEAVGGAKKKKKNKKGKGKSDDVEKFKEASLKCIEDGDLDGLVAMVSKFKEQQKEQEDKEKKEEMDIQALLKMVEELVINKNAETKEESTAPKNYQNQRGGAGGGANRGRGRGNFNQNQNRGPQNRPNQPNRANFQQNRGNFDQNRGNFNQNRGNFQPQRGNFNQNRGNFHQTPPHFNQYQHNAQFVPPPPPMHQYHHPTPPPMHQYPTPPNPNMNISYYHPQQRPTEQPLQLNINLGHPAHASQANAAQMPPQQPYIEPLMSKYLDPPPKYSNLVDNNVHVRSAKPTQKYQPPHIRKPQAQPQPAQKPRAQFKKPNVKKHVPTTNLAKQEDDDDNDEDDDDDDEDDDDNTRESVPSVQEMQKYLQEKRRDLQDNPAPPPPYSRRSEERSVPDRSQDRNEDRRRNEGVLNTLRNLMKKL